MLDPTYSQVQYLFKECIRELALVNDSVTAEASLRSCSPFLLEDIFVLLNPNEQQLQYDLVSLVERKFSSSGFGYLVMAWSKGSDLTEEMEKHKAQTNLYATYLGKIKALKTESGEWIDYAYSVQAMSLYWGMMEWVHKLESSGLPEFDIKAYLPQWPEVKHIGTEDSKEVHVVKQPTEVQPSLASLVPIEQEPELEFEKQTPKDPSETQPEPEDPVLPEIPNLDDTKPPELTIIPEHITDEAEPDIGIS